MYRKKINIVIALFVLIIVAVYGYIYNVSVRITMTEASEKARSELYEYNNEIIERLISAEKTEQWDEIVNSYEQLIVTVEDSNNYPVAQSKENTWTALDVEVRTPFEYKGKAYLIRSSVYLMEDYIADVRIIVKFVLAEFLVLLSALAAMFVLIYALFLRPFTKLYEAIEHYDKTGELEKVKIKGYAGKIYRRFISMTENLEANQRNQRRIIASISHDIKTPLTSIMGYAERLQKAGIAEERKKHYLETVYGKSVEIKELVNEFDEYLSLDQKHQTAIETSSVEKIARSIINDYSVDLEDAGISLIVNNYAEDAVVEIDKMKFKRVFGNIFANSVKHFKTDEKIIRVDIYADKSNVYFHINDSGEGVEEEKLEIIFEPLYTSDEGRKVAGLGLSICREIIDAHSGRIYAQKGDMGGLEICIELDRKK